jgi:hypothetical protein
MIRRVLIGLAALGWLGLAGSPEAAAYAIRVVTADDFVPTRILEVEVGTEVVFSDPRFLHIEMLAADGAPRASRIPQGFSATFDTPGSFRFLATLVNVARPGIAPGHIIVSPRRSSLEAFDYASAKAGVSKQAFEAAQDACLREPHTAGSQQLYVMCMRSRGVIPIK